MEQEFLTQAPPPVGPEQAAETATPAPESTAPTPEASGSPAPEAVG